MNELNHSILGALLLNPSLIDEADLSPDDFSDRERELFILIAEEWKSNHPKAIDEIKIAGKMGGDGAVSFVSSYLDGSIKIDPAIFQSRVRELKKKNLTKEILSSIQSQARSGNLDLDSIRPGLDKYDRLSQPVRDILDLLKPGELLKKLDLNIDWTVEGLIPAQAVTVLHGPGGIGKSWVGLQIAEAVFEGKPIFGRATKSVPVVFIDFENPLPVLVERINKIGCDGVFFWHLGFEQPPPRLDSDDWHIYKNLPSGSLAIIDSLRSSHNLDENSSRDMALIMNRLKEVREKSITILCLHHTSKADQKTYRGSSAIVDLADHTLSLYRINEAYEEIDDEANEGGLFYFGNQGKSRYESNSIFLSFTGQGFELAPDPNIKAIQQINTYIINHPEITQKELRQWISEELGIKKIQRILKLLERGEGRFWISKQESRNRPKIYLPFSGNTAGNT